MSHFDASDNICSNIHARVLVCVVCLVILLIIQRRRRITGLLLVRQACGDLTLPFPVRRLRVLRERNHVRPIRRAWFYPRPQGWFEEMFSNPNLAQLWKNDFRMSKETFEYICQLVGQEISREDTRLRKAIPVHKRVAIALWRFGTRNSFRTKG